MNKNDCIFSQTPEFDVKSAGLLRDICIMAMEEKIVFSVISKSMDFVGDFLGLDGIIYYQYNMLMKKHEYGYHWPQEKDIYREISPVSADPEDEMFFLKGDTCDVFKDTKALSAYTFRLFLRQTQYEDSYGNKFGALIFLSSKKKESVFTEKTIKFIEDYIFIINKTISYRGQEYYLENREQYLKSIVENTTEVIITLSASGYMDNIPSRWTHMTGYSFDETHGVHYTEFINPRNNKALKDYLSGRRIKTRDEADEGYIRNNGKNDSVEFEIRHKDGYYIWIKMKAVKFGDINHNIYICILEDITHSKNYQRLLEYMSFHDKLTGIYNRAYFEKKINETDFTKIMPAGILMGDVNGLKISNDVFGHLKGDLLLQSVSSVLKYVCPDNSTIARWGGDEFIVLLPCCTEEMIKSVIKNFNETSGDFRPDNEIIISVSFGYSIKDTGKKSIGNTIKEADSMMYKNKLFESKSYQSSMLSSLMNLLHEKSDETYEHCERIWKFSSLVGEKLKLSDIYMSDLKLLSKLHDIGVVSLDDTILRKRDKYSEEEYEKIKGHCEAGYRIARSSTQFVHISECILYHHERWDGKGYPAGLSGKRIPLLSRILSVCDAYDSMINPRKYKRVFSEKEAMSELRKFSGTQFDPEIVGIFTEILEKTA